MSMSNPLARASVELGTKLDKSPRSLAVRGARNTMADFVPHLGLDEIHLLAEAAQSTGRGMKGQRDRSLVETLFDGCLRVSEGLGLRPVDLVQTPTGWIVRIVGKGSKPGEAALSASLVARLQAYAYLRQLKPEARFFPITPGRAHQILQRAFTAAGIRKPDGVGAVHILRHSGAIARLQVTGNPKAVQDQLRHRDAQMTLRYWKTLAMEESLEIQKGVDFQW